MREKKPTDDKLPPAVSQESLTKSCLINFQGNHFCHNLHSIQPSCHRNMYPSCDNLTDSARELSICNPARQNETEIDVPLFDEDLEKIVSMTVFLLFGFIFVAGLIGNALVVIGE